jgi:hypothetical protein
LIGQSKILIICRISKGIILYQFKHYDRILVLNIVYIEVLIINLYAHRFPQGLKTHIEIQRYTHVNYCDYKDNLEYIQQIRNQFKFINN